MYGTAVVGMQVLRVARRFRPPVPFGLVAPGTSHPVEARMSRMGLPVTGATPISGLTRWSGVGAIGGVGEAAPATSAAPAAPIGIGAGAPPAGGSGSTVTSAG